MGAMQCGSAYKPMPIGVLSAPLPRHPTLLVHATAQGSEKRQINRYDQPAARLCCIPYSPIRPLLTTSLSLVPPPFAFPGNRGSSSRQQKQEQGQHGQPSWKQPQRKRAPPPPPDPAADLVLARVGPGSTSTFYSGTVFKDAGADDAIVEALDLVGIKRPSHIQVCGRRSSSMQACMHVYDQALAALR
jgi:hypothetical protein